MMSDDNSSEGGRSAGRGVAPAADGHDGLAEPAVFSAVLTPHRSLGPRGFLLVMAIVCAAAAFASLRLAVLGAWPVAIFMALDVLLLYGAFRLSYRSGRAFEEVHVWPHRLVVRQVAPNGRAREHLFNPLWTRLHVTRLEDEGVVRLVLTGEGRTVHIGAFLNPADRGTFAEAFGRVLADIRSGRAVASPAE